MKRIWLFLIFVALCFANENGYVTANLQGQLGNQMFQIATAVAYALDHQCRAVFPGIEQAPDGRYHAEHIFFRLDTGQIAKPVDYTYYENQHTHYTIYSEIPFVKGNYICLNGFFQTPRYFERHADYIKQLFAPSKKIKKKIHEKYGRLLKTPTVALHVRTFAHDGRDPNQTIGTRGWKYFLHAMNHFSDKYTFLIFSDDMDWVKKNFPKTDRKIKFIEGNTHWVDFYLMSFCTHQILPPESTFSWWAAWMNKNPSKMVIAPNSWAGRLDAEIIPPEWIKINIDAL